MLKKILLIMLILYAKIYAIESKRDLLSQIENLYNAKSSINIKRSALKCTLTPKELNEAKLDFSTPIFPYINALLELNTKGYINKVSQDLLMQEAKYKEPLAMLLALQLYFIRKCERCEKIRDISSFDYYRFAESSIEKILNTEGGSFRHSYALKGEAYLCRALESKKDSKDFKAYNFLHAYANLMLAGINTRAINALLEGIKRSNDISLYATFMFLISHDIVVENNINSAYVLNLLSVDSKNYFSNISLIKNLTNLSALEGNVLYDYVTFGLLIRDMEMGRIISPFSKFSTKESLDEFLSKARHYKNEIKKANLRILKKEPLDIYQNVNKDTYIETLREYLRILQLKSRLKSQPHPFYVNGYHID